MIKSLVILAVNLVICHAFVPRHSTILNSLTPLQAVPPELAETVQAARSEFFFWFFGASGGAGLARSAFPRMFQQVRYVQSLKGVGPTFGGETLGLSPLCGYPQDVAKKDV